MKKKIRLGYLFVLVFVLLSALSLYKHKNVEPNSFRSEIWADRAGYYVYLPSAFIYSFSAKEFPVGIEDSIGKGFSIDTINNKVKTRYSYGVALLQMPFFFVADLMSASGGHSVRDGFSLYYQKAIDISATFYLTLGLYLLFLALKRHFKFSNIIIILSLALIFFGTNLFYYGIMETGMSHVYSFFLFSVLIYMTSRFVKPNLRIFPIFGIFIISSLIVLIRPTNLFALGVLVVYDTASIKDIVYRIKGFMDWRIILLAIISVLLVWLPQLVYWKYLSGSYFLYTYKEETFTHLFSPRILEVFFAAKNGLFPYSLLMPFIFLGCMFYTRKRWTMGGYITIVFLIICYLTASWHEWSFSCGMGMRNSVEFLSLLSFPFCFWLNRVVLMKNKPWKFFLLGIVVSAAVINFKISYHYFGCYFGETWNWSGYFVPLFYPLSI